MTDLVEGRMDLIKQTRVAKIALAVAISVMSIMVYTSAAHAQKFTTLYAFTGGTDGGNPSAGVIRDKKSNLYGTTFWGGSAGEGVVFKLDATGHETVMYNFTGGSDGSNPAAALFRNPKGGLYGTTLSGGANGEGTVFKVDSAGETVLYSFSGTDGRQPYYNVIQDAKGTFYGTTLFGGIDKWGAIFSLDKSGKETVLYSFTGQADGANPGPLKMDAAGNLYGTTASGGQGCNGNGCGTVFKVDTNGTLTIVHTFGGTDGAMPWGGVILDAKGNLYGSTEIGGAYGNGTVFKVDTSGMETVLYSFTGGADGQWPLAPLTRDAKGNLYGTTYAGGDLSGCQNNAPGCGTVFKIHPNGKETTLHTFIGGSEGGNSQSALIWDGKGNVYGTTHGVAGGGAAGYGTVWKLKL